MTHMHRYLISTGLVSVVLSCAPQPQTARRAYQPIDVLRSQRVTDANATLRMARDFETRWTTEADAPDATLASVLQAVAKQTGRGLQAADFFLTEDKPLANARYVRYVQLKDGVPVSGKSIRMWSDLATGARIQIECALDLNENSPLGVRRESGERAVQSLIKNARERVANGTEDKRIVFIRTEKSWLNDQLVQTVFVKAKHGTHIFVYSAHSGALLSQKYKGVLEAEDSTYSLPAKVYPIWEFAGSDPTQVTALEAVTLTDVLSERKLGDKDSYSSLAPFKFLYSRYDADKAAFPVFAAQGYWSNESVRSQVNQVFEALPIASNAPASGAKIRLVGKYVGVYLSPDAPVKISPIQFSVDPSPQAYLGFHELPDGDYEGKIATLGFGKPLLSEQDALARDPLGGGAVPNNDPAFLINNGFDEIQVYYAVNYLFESLRSMGFTDPELSTRPMSAILFDPAIEMRDNAYYDNDTINFTTYSPGALNYARDNTTIWHELGHGVMDRLMGPHLDLADSGGLAEGMADFVAQLVINDRTQGTDFAGRSDMRIFNNTAFHMTNESHDDGEAYGGAMNDFLELAIQKYGFKDGLARVADVVLETMRLTRDHPALTAEIWFEHMVFADSLERSVALTGALRQPGELRELIVKALETRNYSMNANSHYSEMIVKNGGEVVTESSDGSRGKPILLRLSGQDSKSFLVSVQLKEGDFYKFKFPVTVRASYQNGPLQGAVHWAAEDKTIQEDVVLKSAADLAQFSLTATGKCDEVNRSDGGCKDFVYLQIWNAGEAKHPVAKKRFYVAVVPK